MRYATHVLLNGGVQEALKTDKDALEGVYQSSPLHSCTHPPPSLILKQLPCSFLSAHLTAQLVFIFGPFVPPDTRPVPSVRYTFHAVQHLKRRRGALTLRLLRPNEFA
jgi:hypothetical protein